MTKIVGAIAAAVLLATGCAHQKSQTQNELPPQASVEGAGQEQIGGAGNAGAAENLNCEVVGDPASSSARSETMTNESSSESVVGSVPADDAIGGSASAASDCVPVESNTVGSTSGSEPLDDTSLSTSTSGSEPLEDTGIGGSASEADALEDTSIGGSVSETDTSEDVLPDDSAPEADAFEDTGMGGAGGGGG